MAEVALAAEIRSEEGSSNSRRLRTSGKIPGVVYGHGITPTSVAVEARALRTALNTEAGLNVLLDLNVGGKKHLALPRDIQRHPVRGTVSHVDFLVVSRDEEITADIPLNFVNEAIKVTKMGGIVEHLLNSVSVTATASTLPSHLEIDLAPLEIEGSIRVKDIPLPKGVLMVTDGEDVIAVGKGTRGAVAAAAEGGAAGSDAAGAAPAK